MSTFSRENSEAIFTQLRPLPGEAVKTVIENHDAWVHNAEVQAHIASAMARRHTLRPTDLAERIDHQRHMLSKLIVRLPQTYSRAG